MKKYTEEDINKFLKENADLMDDLRKQEEIDKYRLRSSLKALKEKHDEIRRLIKELEKYAE